MTGTIVQLNVSQGGVPKLPIPEAEVDELGIVGDGHNNPFAHGGPERALCLYPMELIDELSAEGNPIFPGSMGENVTTRGINWDLVQPGTRLQLGSDVVIEITRYTVPCGTIAMSFKDYDYMRVHQRENPGWSRVYAQVLVGGYLRPGDPIELLAVAVDG